MIKYKHLPEELHLLSNIIDNILPNKYKKLNITIKFIRNKYLLIPIIPEISVDIFKMGFKNEAVGCFTPKENIYIFNFYIKSFCESEYNEDEIEHMYYFETLFAILHEIKHQYQFKNRTTTYLKVDELMKTDSYNYDLDPLEIEADGFAERIVDKNMDLIYKIIYKED